MSYYEGQEKENGLIRQILPLIVISALIAAFIIWLGISTAHVEILK